MQNIDKCWFRRGLKIFAPVILLSTAGCYTYQDPTPMRQEVPQLEVTPVYYSHSVRFNVQDNRPADLEIDQAEAFLTRVGAGRRDVLEIRFIDGPIAETQAEILQALLADGGYQSVLYPVREGDLAPGADKTGVTIAIRKAVVKLPDCPNWSDVPGRKYDNTAFSNFGCSNVTNLGMMVANPEDLLVGQSAQYWDGTRAASSVERYHVRKTEPILKQEALTAGVSSGTGD